MHAFCVTEKRWKRWQEEDCSLWHLSEEHIVSLKCTSMDFLDDNKLWIVLSLRHIAGWTERYASLLRKPLNNAFEKTHLQGHIKGTMPN